MAYFHFRLSSRIILRALYTGVSFMVSLSPEASLDGPEVGGFLCDEAALLWDTMTVMYHLENWEVSSKSESSKYIVYVQYS